MDGRWRGLALLDGDDPAHADKLAEVLERAVEAMAVRAREEQDRLAARVAPVRWPEYLFDVLVACLCFQAAWAIWKNIRGQPASSSPSN